MILAIAYIPGWENPDPKWISMARASSVADQFIVVYDGGEIPREHPDQIPFIHHEEQQGFMLSVLDQARKYNYQMTCVLRQGLCLKEEEWLYGLKRMQIMDAISFSDGENPMLDDSFLLMNQTAIHHLSSIEDQLCSLGYGPALTAILHRAGLQYECLRTNGTDLQSPSIHLTQIASNILRGWLIGNNHQKIEAECRKLRWYSPITDRVSIIVPIWNNLEYTKRCVGSILKFTVQPYELILVDNASVEDVQGWAEKLLRQYPSITYIRNEINHGFPQGCNIGMQAVTGEHVVLLNNDTIVTPYWLTRLVAALVHPRVGLVGGMSTNVGSSLQMIQNPGYRNPKELLAFAGKRGRSHQGRFTVNSVISGLYMLIRGELFQKIGGMDPIFSFGNCEDSDYCFRTHRAGYIAMILQDTYIDHIGGASFAKQRFQIFDLLHQNLHYAICKHLPDGERSRHWNQESRFVDPAWAEARDFDPDWDCLPVRMEDFLKESIELSSPFPKEGTVLAFPHPNAAWLDTVLEAVGQGYKVILRIDPPSPPYIEDTLRQLAQLDEEQRACVHVEATSLPSKFRRSIFDLAQYYIRPQRFDAFAFQRELDCLEIEEMLIER